MEEQKRAEGDLALDVESARSRITEIQQELESVVEQLGEAKVDKHESARAAKKAELIDNLKRLFPGVVSCADCIVQDVDKYRLRPHCPSSLVE